MAYQTIKIRPDGGDEYELEVEARDALMWEKTSRDNASIIDYLRHPSMTELYRLAHLCAKRRQQFTGSLKEFEDSHDVVIVNVDEDENEPDPT